MASRVAGVATVSGAHTINDSYGYVLSALLPVLIPKLGISLSLAGVLLTIQQLTASFSQPIFGHLADRAGGGRWMCWGGIALSGIASACIAVSPSFGWLVAAVAIAGLGTAFFHPVSAGLVAQGSPPHRRAFWMSIYISAGNFGLGLGPLMVAFILHGTGLAGAWLMALPAIVAAAVVWRLAPAHPRRQTSAGPSLPELLHRHGRTIGSLVAVVSVRACGNAAFVAFLPLLATARGAAVAQADQLLTVFLIAGAFGGVLGGWLADHIGRDRVIVYSLVASAPFGLIVALRGDVGAMVWLGATVCGFLLNASQVGLTVRGQESVPGSLRMMSGLMLGLTIGVGGLSVTPMAVLGERIGLGPVLALASGLAIVAAGLMAFVPRLPASS